MVGPSASLVEHFLGMGFIVGDDFECCGGEW
jgi:hypothetical protein